MMFRESEHRHADVSEYKVLCEKIKQLKQLLRPVAGIGR